MEDCGIELTERELVGWYMDQVKNPKSFGRMPDVKEDLVLLVLRRLIEKEGVLVVRRGSRTPEDLSDRVLAKHPAFAATVPAAPPE